MLIQAYFPEDLLLLSREMIFRLAVTSLPPFLAFFDPLRVVERLGECPEMQREPDRHENMEDLMRLAPDIKSSRTPCFG